MAESSSKAAEDGEWEEEETYVLLEMSGVTHEEFIEGKKYQIVGIESESPYFKLDNCVFKGQYQNTIGTCVFFEEGKEKIDNVPMMNYLGKTITKLEMERVFLKPKEPMSDSSIKATISTSEQSDEATTEQDMDTG